MRVRTKLVSLLSRARKAVHFPSEATAFVEELYELEIDCTRITTGLAFDVHDLLSNPREYERLSTEYYYKKVFTLPWPPTPEELGEAQYALQCMQRKNVSLYKLVYELAHSMAFMNDVPAHEEQLFILKACVAELRKSACTDTVRVTTYGR